jgi:excinuclease UvrABC ATPase subunit
MPTLARPEVDVLDGLTTAIIVDQERMGADPRSTVGTATDANAMLRIVFSRLGQPHIGSPQAFAFNVASVRASGAITVERGAGKTERVTFTRTGGMCPRCEGRGSVTDFDLSAFYDDSKSLNEGALTIPGFSMDGWYGRIFNGCGFFDPDKPIRKFTKKELHDLLHKECGRPLARSRSTARRRTTRATSAAAQAGHPHGREGRRLRPRRADHRPPPR